MLCFASGVSGATRAVTNRPKHSLLHPVSASLNHASFAALGSVEYGLILIDVVMFANIQPMH